MFDIVLYQPEIPPNTGNIIRLCANTGCRLHLVKPLGFSLEDKQLQRAGLDYHEYATVKTHENWDECLRQFSGRRVFALTTKGSMRYSEVAFQRDDVFVFGPETRGLPVEVLAQFDESRRIRLPMRAESRSLNLSNSVAVVVFEAWRQTGFEGGK
jgi:tRNA (cytidine/uridine-2'-O-)-methyltransferase